MSTIKSSDEHLTLNADGSSKDIKFQANGVEKASISSAGAFTSTTIDATKLTGNLPAISGANLTGITANVPSSADGQALGSASAEWSDLYLADGSQILFGNDQDVTITHNPDTGLTFKRTATGDNSYPVFNFHTGETNIEDNELLGVINFAAPDEAAGTDAVAVAAAIYAKAEADFTSSVNKTKLVFQTGSSGAADDAFTITNDGRGLSPFTAKAWVQFTGTGTVSIDGSHNISSVSDNGAGRYEPNFTNNMNNANYAMFTSSNGSAGGDSSWQDMDRNSFAPYSQTVSSFKMAGYWNGYQDCSLVCGLVFADGT